MMPQMEENYPRSNPQPDPIYGAYSQQQYETPYQPTPQAPAFDDSFVEAVSQRIAQHLKQSSDGKISTDGKDKYRMPADQRTGIAIVSILALIPLGVVLGTGGFGALISLGFIALIIYLINAEVNKRS